MSDAITIAATGLKSQEYYINQIANDLANLNTTNYKASKLAFEDILYQSPETHLSLGLGAAVYKTGKDFSNGPLKPTENWNDVAIDGQGFFQVINQEGALAFSRNSHLSIDADRYLATEEGLRLADEIQVPEEFVEIIIQKNGDVEAILADEPQPQLLGNIKLAKFMDPNCLTEQSNGIYLPKDEAADPIIDSPGHGGLGMLLQKQVEGSNVDMVRSLMQLTLAQRIYQLNAKAIQVADELEKMTNEIRA